jgi:pimeloyl-ACP methyl ester carboxylesterase
MRFVRALILTAALFSASTGEADTAKVNGLDLYYEVHGKGRPLVLLHGAFCTIEACFGDMIQKLARSHQVIAIEMQGHGHTADIDRPLTTANMADDTAVLLKQLKIAQADVFGYSMGGGVAMELARRHPSLVRKLVLAGTPLTRDGWHPGMLDGIKAIKPEEFAKTPWHAAYVKVAPKPDQFANLVRKVQKLDILNSGWTLDDIRAVKAPVLYMIGDSDVVRPEHAVEMFRLFGGGVAGDVVGLPRAQLAILPGTTHVTIVHNPLLVPLLAPFLDAK